MKNKTHTNVKDKLPEAFELVDLQLDDGKENIGWWTGYKWHIIGLNCSKSKVQLWKKTGFQGRKALYKERKRGR
jgi:hypothetical protein